MAAYAALVSLMNTVEQILNHSRLSNSFDKKQAESVGELIGFLLDFIESSHNSHGGSKEEVEDLERQIASAAHAAEDIIENHMVDQIHARFNETSPRSLTHPQKQLKVTKNKKEKACLQKVMCNLQKVIEEMDCIKGKVMTIKAEEKGSKDRQPKYSMPAASSRPLTTGKTTMVGFENYLTQLLEVLTGDQSNRQIIPVVGMGGIGKTTLARNAYENFLVVRHFDVRTWITISQEYNVRKILFETLFCLGKSSSGMDKSTEDELGEQLYRTLSGRRYLIILDDMWNIEAWNKIKFFFPENYNRSRIIVTTRLLDVVDHFGSLRLVMNFLNDEESWNLFCEKAFGQEGCPPDLEKVGKKIVNKCRGLPLSIVVIGGILGKSSRTLEWWEDVAKDISSIVNSRDNSQCLNILFLSYRHLPACLKPCFLHLGIFPEDHQIFVSQLIKLWVAEGFLKPNEDQSLEEIAEGYIRDLVDRNLILVHGLGKDGRLKTCYMHDLLRDLCLKIAEEKKFLSVIRVLDTPRDIDRERRLIIHGSDSYHTRVLHTSGSSPLARSLIYIRAGEVLFNPKLLRVLLVEYHDGDSYPRVAFQQVNLRFFAQESGTTIFKLPQSISLLWNVQTLIIDKRVTKKVVAPSEIWEMPQLRHIKIGMLILPDPPPSDERDDCVVLRNLQTLKRVKNLRFSQEVTKRMPNIKKLSIHFDFFSRKDEKDSYYSLHNVGHLNKLESLKYYSAAEPDREKLLQDFRFPSSLKKLDLCNCKLHWNDLTIIGSLPLLEVLQLRQGSIRGAEWNPVEGEFRRLKFLEISYCDDLIYWNADKSHFPVLENLVLCSVEKLNEIPSGIGDIPTLQRIYLEGCSVPAGISAVKILEEQESLDNQGLRLEVWFWYREKLEEFREQMQIEGLTVHNIQVSSLF